ncbi:MAG: PHP domain-containing protein [Thermodesulfobacteriota bacterium]
MNQTNMVQFEKPNLAALTKQYTVVDLHYHTRHSDGQATVEQVAEHARSLGIGVAITDHNEIKGALEIDAYDDILSIPGIEITSREGTHLLVYFYDTNSLKAFYQKDIQPYMGHTVMSSISLTIEEIVLRARTYKTLIVFPHPFSAVYTGICNFYFSKERLAKIFELVDGVEVINAENMHKWNLKSAVLGFNIEKSMTGGSDGHKLKDMGNAVCYAACDGNRAAFLDALRQRSNKVVGKEIAILEKVTSNGAKLKININNYPDLIEKNIKYGYTVLHSKSISARTTMKQHFSRGLKRRISRLIPAYGWLRYGHNLAALIYLLPLITG